MATFLDYKLAIQIKEIEVFNPFIGTAKTL